MQLLHLLPIVASCLTLTSAAPQAHSINGIGLPISNIQAASDSIIPSRYIVVYQANASSAAVEVHQASVHAKIKRRNVGKRAIDGRELSTMMHTFNIEGFRAMCIDADDKTILDIDSADEVAYIEADTKVQIAELVRQPTAPAGLNRISHASALGQGYVFDNATDGAGVVAYVVDTGIMVSHSEYGGRASFGANFVNDVDTDENGHGSHVAGTIAGATFGVAKRAELVAVKVLDADGSGTNAAVIMGLNFVATDATARELKGKSVMNISIGGSKSSALNSAIAAVTNAGIVVAVAAGNSNVDAANTSPASAPSAITVGAIDASTDAKASFSNFGSVVDIFAPGVKVQSVGITSNTATAVLSGTSMASPHIAGLAAYLISTNNLNSVDAVVAKMKELAGQTGAKVSGVKAGTTTLIAYNGSGL